MQFLAVLSAIGLINPYNKVSKTDSLIGRHKEFSLYLQGPKLGPIFKMNYSSHAECPNIQLQPMIFIPKWHFLPILGKWPGLSREI